MKRKDTRKLRGRPDTVAQPFNKRDHALLYARLLERLTGESCAVFSSGWAWFWVMRCTSGRWIKA
jgi:hypothetical protein